LALGSGPCGPIPLPDNYIDQLFQGDPATKCQLWLDTIVDIYLKRMECSADDNHLTFGLHEEVEYEGHRWRALQVGWYSDPPDAVLKYRRHTASLERLLAPLVGAEAIFRHAETGAPLDLFPRPLVSQLILGDDQIARPPPAVLIAVDRALGEAKRKRDAELPPVETRYDIRNRDLMNRLNHAGPVQDALVPVGKLLNQKCGSRLHTGAALAQLAASPQCQRALPIDPFLKALFGADRVGQAVSIHEQARAAEANAPAWWRRFLPSPAPEATPPPGRGKRSGGAR
jgi:hypothetical protein